MAGHHWLWQRQEENEKQVLGDVEGSGWLPAQRGPWQTVPRVQSRPPRPLWGAPCPCRTAVTCEGAVGVLGPVSLGTSCTWRRATHLPPRVGCACKVIYGTPPRGPWQPALCTWESVHRRLQFNNQKKPVYLSSWSLLKEMESLCSLLELHHHSGQERE